MPSSGDPASSSCREPGGLPSNDVPVVDRLSILGRLERTSMSLSHLNALKRSQLDAGNDDWWRYRFHRLRTVPHGASSATFGLRGVHICRDSIVIFRPPRVLTRAATHLHNLKRCPPSPTFLREGHRRGAFVLQISFRRVIIEESRHLS